MGYILPITNDSYVNYHYRMLASRSSPHYIGRPNKISYPIIQQNQNDFYKQYQSFQIEQHSLANKKEMEERSIVNQNRDDTIDQQTVALLTGKGMRMNVRV